MITKGTAEYQKAQELANKLEMQTRCPRSASNYTLVWEKFNGKMLEVAKLEGFAGEVAKTVEASMVPQAFNLAKMSSKQAWIIACAMVENGIEY